MHSSLIITLASGTTLHLQPVTVAAAEAIAQEYTPAEFQAQQDRVLRQLAENSIVAIEEPSGIKEHVTSSAELRRRFPLLRDWATIKKAYAKITQLDRIETIVRSTLEQIDAGADAVTFHLPSGQQVTLKPLTLDDAERIDLQGNYTANEFMRALHDKIAAAITHVDGRPTDPATFDPRVQFPNYADWFHLSAVHNAINSDQEDIATFFPNARHRNATTAKQHS